MRRLVLVLSLLVSSRVSADRSVVLTSTLAGCSARELQVREVCAESRADAVIVPIHGDATTIDVPAGAWELSVVGPSCWSAPVRFTAPTPPGDVIKLKLYPAAEVVGTLKPTDGEPEVKLMARVGVAGESGDLLAAAPYACTREEQKFRCRVPAASFDVRLEAAGYAPVYLFGLTLATGESRDLATVTLTRGASVAGWVELPRRQMTNAPPRVDLRNVSIGAVDAEAAPSYTAATTTANQRGFFHFTNVEPGMYLVEASSPGLASGRSERLTVRKDEELVLHAPMRLALLSELDVLVTPPVQENGKPWQVRLLWKKEGERHLRPVRAGTATVMGQWTVPGLEQGVHVLEVSDSAGSIRYRDGVTVQDARQFQSVTIQSVRVAGTVTAGDEPVEGSVTLSRDRRDTVMAVSSEGTFAGVISGEGTWRVTVHPAGGGKTEIRAGTVEVRRESGEEVARIAIELPGGGVAGSVTDEQGNPVHPAVVYIYRGNRLVASGRADEDGRFSITGLPEQPVTVVAADSSESESDTLALDLSTRTAVKDVTLVIPAARVAELVLTTESGSPVIGALVKYMRSGSNEVRRAVTGPSGTTRLRLSGDRATTLAINAPGLPKKIITVQPSERRLHVVLRAAAAQLTVTGVGMGRFPFVASASSELMLLTSLIVSLDAGTMPLELRSGHFSAAVEEGAYLLCPTSVAGPQCQRMTLASGTARTFDVETWWPAERKKDAP